MRDLVSRAFGLVKLDWQKSRPASTRAWCAPSEQVPIVGDSRQARTRARAARRASSSTRRPAHPARARSRRRSAARSRSSAARDRPTRDERLRLRVALLHNYRDEQQPSMRLYAERLGEALRRRQVPVTRVRPPGVVPDAWRARSPAWAKVDGYVGPLRRLSAPACATSTRTSCTSSTTGRVTWSAGLDRAAHGRHLSRRHPARARGRADRRRAASRRSRLQLFRISLELMKRAAVVVADSTQTKRDLVDFVGVDPDKITVIHPGLNQPFAPRSRARARRCGARFGLGDGPLMLQIGRGVLQEHPRRAARPAPAARRTASTSGSCASGRALAGEERALAERLGRRRPRRRARRRPGRGPAGALQRRRPAAVSVAVRGIRLAAARGDGVGHARRLLARRFARRGGRRRGADGRSGGHRRAGLARRRRR